MFNDLANKAFRIAFLAENIRNGLAFSIRAIRESQKMTQGQLAEKAKKPASVISRLEDPNYGRYTIRTLLDLAAAFDVALLIKFVPYSRLISETKDLSPKALAALSYSQEKEGLADGMSLRQYAAIEAMKGLIIRGFTISSFAAQPDMLAQIVKDSYDIADAILAERIK